MYTNHIIAHKMKNQFISMLSSLFVVLLFVLVADSKIDSTESHDQFLQCLQSQPSNNNSFSNIIFSQESPSYSSLFLSLVQNLRFAASSNSQKPTFIVTPTNETQIREVVLCSKLHGLQIRVRSGGHDYEGLSYLSKTPFVIIDLRNLKTVSVDTKNKVAWVQGGALLGELYHSIAQKSPNLAFPAGLCPTVGVGGHVSGGGLGTLIRKYGLSADNVVDARIMNVNGDILDRKSMGEELFWAIRGGGVASFGVLLDWKFNLVDVPSVVTAFRVNRTLEQNATMIVHKWQERLPTFEKDLFIRTVISSLEHENGKTTAQATFEGLYLGGVAKLFEIIEGTFPELGLTREDCSEMSWYNSTLFFHTYPPRYYKAKSDFVTTPIPENALEGLWKKFYADEAKEAQLIFHPYGGRMDEINQDETAFPHRKGNLFEIQHLVYWEEEDNGDSKRFTNWLTNLYDYMTPYVSNSPRACYFNYRDLDLGVNNEKNTSYASASVWGARYFKSNFLKLAQVKTKVDPGNFFRSEQSIPTL